MAAQDNDVLYAERLGIGGKFSVGDIKDNVLPITSGDVTDFTDAVNAIWLPVFLSRKITQNNVLGTSTIVNHNLNTSFLLYSILELATNEYVFGEVKRVDNFNTEFVTSPDATPTPAGTYRITIWG